MMAAEAKLIGNLKVEFGNNPVVSNVVFAFLLALVEKMLEVEFACPCNYSWNAVFVAPFFLIPAATASLLMWLIHGASENETKNENENKDKIKKKIKNIIFCVLPSIVWMALMLLNGRYFVCAFSTWPGRFVADDKTYLKWCRPTNTTIYSEENLLTHSHRLYIVSQGLGNVVVTVLLCFLIGYIICKMKSKCCKKADNAGRCQTQEGAISDATEPLQGQEISVV